MRRGDKSLVTRRSHVADAREGLIPRAQELVTHLILRACDPIVDFKHEVRSDDGILMRRQCIGVRIACRRVVGRPAWVLFMRLH